jgi:hypothetical protein
MLDPQDLPDGASDDLADTDAEMNTFFGLLASIEAPMPAASR